jgi:branched-chain amino acid transport system substrate-binding protein
MKSRMARQKQLGVTILAIALTALLLVTACAPPEGPPPIKKKAVELGEIGSFTGPGASGEPIFLAGMLDYVKYFNEEGRIPGVTVEIVWRDSARTMERWLSAYEAFKGRGISVMISNETLGIEPYQAKVEKDQIPMYIGNPVQEIVYPPRWYYFRSPTWAEMFAVLAEYLMENWQEERPPKLAFITVDSSFGRQIEVTGTKYAESLGFEMLPMEFIPYVPIDTTTQLLRVRERGADFVYISWLQFGAGVIMRDAERLGLFEQIHFTGLDASVGKQMIEMAGTASEGYLVPTTVPSFAETDVPGIKLMLDTQMKYYGRVKVEEPEYVFGWTGTVITCEAIRRAVENVGYENLDGPAIKEAFDGIKGFDVQGLVNITYTPDDHRGSSKVAIYQVKGGEIVRITDWRDAPMLVP